jgi:signal transduction histidine kinase
MFKRVASLLKVTAVRLSIIYTVIFGVLALGIVFYMTGATVNVLREQYQASIDEEVTGLARIYRQGGINSLVRTLDRRARAPGANLYVITNPQGEIIAGNVPKMQNRIMSKIGWTKRPFRYERFDDDGDKEHRAIARVLEVPNGMRILVGRDVSEYEGVREIVRRGFNLALGTMVALGLLTWFFVGRRALKRIDQVSKSSQRIMGGDKSERLPVTGTQDEFDRLSENLNHMLDQINHLDDGVKQMSDNIAHDLKTPITRLRNKAEEAFALENKPQEQQDKIADIIDDCDSIVKTFDALLMISRVESGSTVAKLERLNAGDVLNDVYELYEALVEDEGKQLNLELNLPDNLEIMGNRELLSQAISNLIDNAIKYGGDTITLNAELQDKDLSMKVIDSGDGIAEEDRGRVIERFVRLDKSRNMSGNGLGLSLVKAISKMHKGSFNLIDSDQGFAALIKIPYLEQ